jgi:hypothetical protein
VIRLYILKSNVKVWKHGKINNIKNAFFLDVAT